MMVAKKKPMMYLDVTKPNERNNYNLLDSKNKIVGEVPVKQFEKHPEDYLTDEITTIRYTGWRKPKVKKSKAKRCKCK